jgi:hypothetical protein
VSKLRDEYLKDLSYGERLHEDGLDPDHQEEEEWGWVLDENQVWRWVKKPTENDSP